MLANASGDVFGLLGTNGVHAKFIVTIMKNVIILLRIRYPTAGKISIYAWRALLLIDISEVKGEKQN